MNAKAPPFFGTAAPLCVETDYGKGAQFTADA